MVLLETGEKSIDYNSSTWDDHDERCHGTYDSLEDEPDYAEGFMWNCCDMAGDDKGCKKTKHKTPANRVVQVVQARKPNPLKRKAREELHRPTHARCSECYKRFYLRDNHNNACSSHHPGAFLFLHIKLCPS